MIDYSTIAEASRHLDTQAEEGRELDELVRQRGIDTLGLMRAAEQRALRIAMIMDGRDPRLLSRTEKTPVDLSPETRKLLTPLQLAFVDGFMAGRATTDPDDKVQRFPNKETK